MPSQLLTEWEPSATTRAFAAGLEAAGINVEAELKKFRDYPRRDGLHDADRAYVAWLKKAVSFQAGKRQLSAGEAPKSSDTDRWIAEIREFSQSSFQEFERIRKYMEGHRWWARSGREFQLKQMLFAIRERSIIFTYLDEEGREF